MSSISTPYYKAIDLSLIFIACSLAYWARFDTLSLPLYYYLPTGIFVVISTFSLSITGFYRRVGSPISIQVSGAAINGLVITAILTATCLFLTKTSADYSRIWLVSSVVIAFCLLILSRSVLSLLFNISIGTKAIVLLGSNQTAGQIKNKLNHDTDKKLFITRHFKIDTSDKLQAEKDLLSSVAFIESSRKQNQLPISEVWITHDVFSRHNFVKLDEIFGDSSINLVFIPEIPSVPMLDVRQFHFVSDIPTINSNLATNQRVKQLLKFVEDQVIGWLALITTLPILLVTAILIKIDSRGPIFYRQTRYGTNGKEFEIWKFRTMSVTESTEEFKQAINNDPRITAIGKVLRKYSIDELPQIFNVLSGNMSLVGPRPHPNLLNEQYRSSIDKYMLRHKVKPGITGLAQVRGFRGETSDSTLMQRRVEYDLEYIQNWNLISDFKILAATLFQIIPSRKIQ